MGTQVIMDLCQTGDYQTEYLKHAQCMRQAQTEYESCVDVYQLRIKTLNKGEMATEDEQEVNSTCGSHTAGFTKQFLDRMSGPLVQQHCQHYEHGSEMCPDQPRDHVSHQSPRYQDTSDSGSDVTHVSTILYCLVSLAFIVKFNYS